MLSADLRRNLARALTLPAASLCLLTTPAFAGEPTELDSHDQEPLISNGSPVAACAWPTAVAVTGGGGLCTGTLIHPQLVVYAAHCGAGNKTIRFGESAFAGGRTEKPQFCMTNPDYLGTNDQGHDWAFCKLQNPVTDLPITPPLHGDCETSILQVGQEVAVVGFGQTLQGNTGDKNWGMTSLAVVNKAVNILVLGVSGEPSVCPGDSGGPVYVRFPDNSWRAVGIASTVSGGCGGSGTHSLITGAIPWLEQESGLDLTPCTLADGSWAPGPGCEAFSALDPNVGTGTWSDWCSGQPVSVAADQCGTAWDQFDAENMPTVAITSPVWGDTFAAGTMVDITIDALKHPQGAALKEVRLDIDGSEVAADTFDPWGFTGATFNNEGVFTLTAVAEDWNGNIVKSKPVAIGIGNAEVPPEPEDTGEEGGESGEDGEGEGEGNGSADEVGESESEGDGDGDTSMGDGDADADTSTGDGDADSSTGDGDGESSTGDDEGEVVDACAFEPSTSEWPLPQEFIGADVYEDLTDYWGCDGGGEYRYQLLDLTGDGAVDFLVTDACDVGGVGLTSWDVFENTGTGFAAQPITWSLPQYLAGNAEFYEKTADYWSCDGGQFRFQLLDMTGDGAVDFLVTDACDEFGVGATNWLVHENTGSGFAAQPIEWPLPQVFQGQNEIYEQITDYWSCNGGQYRYQLLDMTGDGAIDFLVTDACDEFGVGATNWLVHENTGSGFAAQPVEWPLPQVFQGQNEIYEQTTDYWSCNGGQYRYQLLDMTGDGAVDFLITDACDEFGVGATNWLVHENTGTAFAAQPIEWPLPTPLGNAEIYEQTADYWTCNGEYYKFQTLDLTGDHAPDLVVTDNCDAAGAGTDRWDVFKNTGTGFAAQPIAWPLPSDVMGIELHQELSDYWSCDGGQQYRYTVFDLTGDGAPDFVATDLCDGSGAGTTHWSVAAAVCE
ncbi:MAG: trypsin-like serine protease [Deltaproteobacteria bacterium]|nr:trypsin-like serine protease [Deltaproteobacteria bacterium]